MSYSVIAKGESRSFPKSDPFLAAATVDADVVVYLGAALVPDDGKAAILVELGTESLGVHTGEASGEEGSNILGFARYCNGSDAPSKLVELVRQPCTKDSAIAAAKAVLESAGLTVVVCSDQPGRIIDRLVRPKYNAALRFLDEGLATAKDMDLTCRLGLGYADGPIERVERGGLAYHYDVTKALFDVFATPAYAPSRRAIVAKQRETKS
ncbi:MAG: 3-hydroxyacyl-CoA dehydrogenase family protein [Hyphomicrobiaceae bacterium]